MGFGLAQGGAAQKVAAPKATRKAADKATAKGGIQKKNGSPPHACRAHVAHMHVQGHECLAGRFGDVSERGIPSIGCPRGSGPRGGTPDDRSTHTRGSAVFSGAEVRAQAARWRRDNQTGGIQKVDPPLICVPAHVDHMRAQVHECSAVAAATLWNGASQIWGDLVGADPDGDLPIHQTQEPRFLPLPSPFPPSFPPLPRLEAARSPRAFWRPLWAAGPA